MVIEMEVFNMVPAFPMMELFMGLMGRLLLAIGLYYMGKALWITLRSRC